VFGADGGSDPLAGYRSSLAAALSPVVGRGGAVSTVDPDPDADGAPRPVPVVSPRALAIIAHTDGDLDGAAYELGRAHWLQRLLQPNRATVPTRDLPGFSDAALASVQAGLLTRVGERGAREAFAQVWASMDAAS
jgi:hypothetical protein